MRSVDPRSICRPISIYVYSVNIFIHRSYVHPVTTAFTTWLQRRFLYIFFCIQYVFLFFQYKTQKTTPIYKSNVYYLVKCRPVEWFMVSDTQFLTWRNNAHNRHWMEQSEYDPFLGANIFLLGPFRHRYACCELVDGHTRTSCVVEIFRSGLKRVSLGV